MVYTFNPSTREAEVSVRLSRTTQRDLVSKKKRLTKAIAFKTINYSKESKYQYAIMLKKIHLETKTNAKVASLFKMFS